MSAETKKCNCGAERSPFPLNSATIMGIFLTESEIYHSTPADLPRLPWQDRDKVLLPL